LSTAELEELVGHLAALGRGVVNLLRRDADVPQISAVAGGQPPNSVVEWFEWCNGVLASPGQTQDDINIIPGYNPVSLGEVDDLRTVYSSDPLLGERWIPLLRSAGGDIYAASWSSSGDEPVVVGVLVGEETIIEFSTIAQMVRVFNSCYEQQAYFVDEHGRLMLDPEIYERIYSDVTGIGDHEVD
jgi:hypothetical protein